MIKPEQIPDEVVDAAKEAWYANQHRGTQDRIALTIAAALNAWPDGTVSKFEWGKAFINLPLPHGEQQ